MNEPVDLIAAAITLLIVILLVGQSRRLRKQRDKARARVAQMNQQDIDRLARERTLYGCPDQRIWHRRSALPGVCFDLPTGTLIVHKRRTYKLDDNPIPSTIKTVNWKGL